MAHEIRILRTPRTDLAVVRIRSSIQRIPEVMGPAFEDVAAYLGPRGLLGTGPAIAVYSDMDADGVTVAAGFTVAQPVEGDGHVVPLVLPESEVITTTHVGPYETLSQEYGALEQAAAARGRSLGPLMWEEYWSPPDTPPEETRTFICWPLSAD